MSIEDPDCSAALEEAECVEAALSNDRSNAANVKHDHSEWYTTLTVRYGNAKAVVESWPLGPERTARLQAIKDFKDTAKDMYDAALEVYVDAVLTYDEALETLDAARAMEPCSQAKIDALNSAIAQMQTAASRLQQAITDMTMNISRPNWMP